MMIVFVYSWLFVRLARPYARNSDPTSPHLHISTLHTWNHSPLDREPTLINWIRSFRFTVSLSHTPKVHRSSGCSGLLFCYLLSVPMSVPPQPDLAHSPLPHLPYLPPLTFPACFLFLPWSLRHYVSACERQIRRLCKIRVDSLCNN